MHNHHDVHQPSYGLTDAALNTDPDDEPPLLLPLTRFAHLHLQHILSHPPDSVLFPFLHGLEGDNHAQNTFFSSSSSPSPSPSPSPSSSPPHPSTTTSSSPPPPPSPTPSSTSTRQRTGKPVRVPRYRGLVWVVCEDDLDAEPGRYARELGVLRRKRDGGFGDMEVDTDSGVDTGTDAGGAGVGGTSVNGLPGTPALEGGGSESGGSSDFEEDEEDDEDEDEDVDVDVDVGVNVGVSVGGGEECMRVDVVPGDAMDVDGPGTRDTIRLEIVNNRTGEVGGKEDEGKHMHPVVARPAPIQTANLPPSFLSTTSSDGLSTSFTSTGSSDCESNFSFSPLDNTTAPPPPATNADIKPTLTTAPIPNPTSIKSTSVPIPASASAANGNATPNGAPEELKPPSQSPSPSHSQPQPHPEQEQTQTQTQKQAANPPPTADLALLTCTFRPSEILRRVVKAQRPTLRLPGVNGCGHGHVPGEYIEGARLNSLNNGEVRVKETEGEKEEEKERDEGGWEFVPARVPDGISLRNFGIQVPIYATLSDIVVYSPKGPTSNALALARRLKEAVRRKWEERVARLGGFPDANELDAHGQGQRKHHPDLLNYNVFVLNATAAEMQADVGVPHLVMRLCGGGVPGAVSAASVLSEPGTANGTWSAKGNGVANGHAIHPGDEEEEWEGMCFDGDADTDMDIDHFTTTSATARCHATPVRAPRIREPNTVDFAQREKEEMRDLTKASEIICVGPPSLTSTLTNANMNIDTNANTTITTTSTPADEASASSAKWKPHVGQVFLGNSDDVPLAPDVPTRFRHASVGVGESESRSRERAEEEDDPEDPFNYHPTNDPEKGFGYDICIECHDLAPFPTNAHLRAAEEHLAMLDVLWEKRVEGKGGSGDGKGDRNNGTKTRRIPPRPPPNANAVIHLPFPSSPTNTQTAMNALMPVIRFLEKWLAPVVPPPPAPPPPPPVAAPPPGNNSSGSSAARRWSSVTALMPHFPFPGSSSSSSSSSSSVPPPPPPIPPPTITTAPSRMRSLTSPAGHPPAPPPAPLRTRPIKILLYSADGYTESSVPALCLLMAVKHLTLPEAYLELQVTRRRSFFVYHQDLAVLRRVESRLREDAERVRVERERERVERELMEKKREREERERERERARVNEHTQTQEQEREKESEPEPGVNGNGKRVAAAQGSWGSVMGNGWRNAPKAPQGPAPTPPGPPPTMGRPAAKSVSFAQAPGHIQPVRSPPMVVPSQSQSRSLIISGTPPAQGMQISSTVNGFKGRPRANTSPWLPSVIGAHHTWFNDQRFDGSFPSRVLPFLYLGNLNHAANAYMLHALGITHVVSVGECALVPPPHHQHAQAPYHPPSSSPFHHPGPNVHYIQGKGPGQGSLWHEEREGRIKVLDIKGVCDDGIDTLEPQLEPICDWIDQARVEGGQVLVHCRVGVSRSATVTIAYVMKHLGLPLVDAYLIVRSRRLSVLIQPNMRLLYNLCGWEIKLAKARAGDNEVNLRRELARTLSWPYLAKEVHALNEKYLH